MSDKHATELAGPPHIVVALCTYNGAQYLREQLDSISRQSHPNWSLWASDDGSDDATIAILNDFAQHHDVTILNGPKRGAAANFLSILTRKELPRAMVALCDQDDIWAPQKLARAAELLASAQGPAVYGAGSVHVTPDGRVIGQSRTPPRAPGFRHAVLQNAVSGHSTVLNPEALDLVQAAGSHACILYHDWWIYQLLSGCGADLILDDARVLQYRQHGQNTLGGHNGLSAQCHRVMSLFDGTYSAMVRGHLKALHATRHLLTKQNAEIVARLLTANENSPLATAMEIIGQRLYRQSRLETSAVILGAFAGRI